MEKFKNITAVAAPLPEVNVDTDKIIPKQYLKTIERTGLGKGLFSELRYNDDGTENEDFVLNKSQYRNAKILVAGITSAVGQAGSTHLGRFLTTVLRLLFPPHLLIYFTITVSKMACYLSFLMKQRLVS